jgi:hypothetical protein
MAYGGSPVSSSSFLTPGGESPPPTVVGEVVSRARAVAPSLAFTSPASEESGAGVSDDAFAGDGDGVGVSTDASDLRVYVTRRVERASEDDSWSIRRSSGRSIRRGPSIAPTDATSRNATAMCAMSQQ